MTRQPVRRRPAGAFLLELAEAAAEALRLTEGGALRLELAEARFELAHVRAAPAVLALVEIALALREKLLARRDRVGVVGELAARSEKRLLGRAKLVETGLDLARGGPRRDRAGSAPAPRPRVPAPPARRAVRRSACARASSAASRSASAGSPFAEPPSRCAAPDASAASRAATARSRSASAAARFAMRSEAGSTRGGSSTAGAWPAWTRAIAARSSSSRCLHGVDALGQLALQRLERGTLLGQRLAFLRDGIVAVGAAYEHVHMVRRTRRVPCRNAVRGLAVST